MSDLAALYECIQNAIIFLLSFYTFLKRNKDDEALQICKKNSLTMLIPNTLSGFPCTPSSRK